MSPDEYEDVVAEIVAGICRGASDLGDMVLGSGRSNRLLGASGYKHQIDVSLYGKSAIYLIECKRWEAKIGVEEVMVLAARGSDIAQSSNPFSVQAILASRVGATRGARQLANYFRIELEIVNSPQEFGLKIGRHVSIGVVDSVAMSDDASCIQRRKGVAIEA